MHDRPVFRSARVVSAGTALSRALGLVREILMAWVFGTSLAKSAFDVAFRIPNLFRGLFGEGALAAAFIPVYARTLREEGEPAANRLAGRALTLLTAVLLAITLAGILIVSGILRSAAVGPRAAAVLPLLRIMLPYTVFICAAALCMAMLQTRGRFAVPALTPVVLNVTWIGVLLWIVKTMPGDAMTRARLTAWGILAAGALQLLVQAPALRRAGIRPRLAWPRHDPALRRMLILMGPAAFGIGLHRVNVCIDGILALWAAPWAPAALTFAERLVYLPLGVFATALGTVMLPTLSHQAVAGHTPTMLKTLRAALRGLMVVMIPAAVGLIVMAAPIVEAVYRWRGGAFDDASALYTARALRFYAPGLVVFSVGKLVTPVFYALQDTRTPVRIGAWTTGINLALNVLFVLTWPQGWRHAGLALATVLAAGLNCVWLLGILRRRLGGPVLPGLAGSMLRMLAAAAMMALAIVAVRAAWPLPAGLPPKAAQIAGVVMGLAAGLAVYAAAAATWCRAELRLLFGRGR